VCEGEGVLVQSRSSLPCGSVSERPQLLCCFRFLQQLTEFVRRRDKRVVHHQLEGTESCACAVLRPCACLSRSTLRVGTAKKEREEKERREEAKRRAEEERRRDEWLARKKSHAEQEKARWKAEDAEEEEENVGWPDEDRKRRPCRKEKGKGRELDDSQSEGDDDDYDYGTVQVVELGGVQVFCCIVCDKEFKSKPQ